MNKILFAKLNPKAKIPTKRDEDGCYDLYICSDTDIVINPHEIKLVPTGIASVFDKKYRIAFRERGSNTKSKLIVMAGQIDSGYRGEWFISLYNTQHTPFTIKLANVDESEIKAACQFAVEEVPVVEIEEITIDKLKDYKSERMTGKLGSSKK